MGSGMSRLITFGDSFTFGHHLPDPNTQSWPAILADLLNRELVNVADPGASNIEILTAILSFDFKDMINLLDRKTFSRVDLALDNSHPGVKSHLNTANNIYKAIHATK
jgi:hypothetical protein